jgi:AAA+ ATPase superfamily predicted ATPase
MFINREEEKKILNEIFNSKKAELVLVYGRRRVGKSRLLIEAIKKMNALYFLADASDNILDIMAKQTNEKFVKFSNWDDFFDFILKSKYEIFVIDEFQYLYQVNKAWPTILQRWWEKLKETNKKIILCGSLISTIYRIARGYGSALYGRKTREINITPLRFKCIRGMLPSYTTEELIKAYCILGGVPRYLEEFDKNKTIEENFKEKLFEKTSFLYNEPINLLTEEFRDFSSYLSILLAISGGKTKFNEIADYSHILTNKLSKYMAILERIELIKKEIPITENKLKTKITRYFIRDNFYNFWLSFVMKNKALIEQGLKKQVIDSILPQLNDHYGRVFEEICKEIILEKQKGITKLGRWWYKDCEIDIVAMNEKDKICYFAECKWKGGVNAEEILEALKEKSNKVKWKNKEREEVYVIIAKSFSKRTDEAILIDLKEIEKILD